MAFAHPLFAACLLLCSLLVIASANDYSYDSSKNQAYSYGAKPEGEEKPNYGIKPTPTGEEKPEYGTKPDFYKPQPEDKEKPDYGTEPPVHQPQPEKPESGKEEKPDYGTKKNFYKPQPEEKEKPELEKEKPDYGTKPDFYKPQPEENKKPESSEEVEEPNYNAKPDFYNPKSEEKENSSYDRKPYVAEPNSEAEEKPDHYGTELPDFYPPQPEVLPIGVQGLVLCKSGPKYEPIEGALARITCLAVDENGYEKPHSVCSGKTDKKGYFFATLSPLGLDDVDDQLTKLTECKAFLESSPLETCNVPVDVNKGISGAPLSDFRVLNQKKMKLYSVGPFFFTSEPNSVPNGY